MGCYTIPTAYVQVRGVFTNTAPVDAYRGAGRPEAIYAIERLIDFAAQEIGLSPDEMRRRNLIPADAMPFTTAFDLEYDSGEFQQHMEQALDESGWHSFKQRQSESAARHKLRGIGMACYIERCAGGAPEQARLAVDGKGHVTLYIGTQNNGQGQRRLFARSFRNGWELISPTSQLCRATPTGFKAAAAPWGPAQCQSEAQPSVPHRRN